jgi:nucleoid-associated protein YgaU
MSFLKELDGSGFIDRLYKATPVVASGETRASAAPPSTTEKGTPAAPKKPIVSDLKQKTEKLARAPQASSSTSTEYTVKAGDTLSHLALQYYGHAGKWPQIYEANKETMKNPHYLFIGQKIFVPADATRAG